MTDFSSFVSTVKTKSVAQQSHYFLNLIPPQFAMSSAANGIYSSIPFYVEAVNLPESHFATREVNDTGVIREVPYQPLFGTVTATMFCDSDMLIKKFFDNWLNVASNTRRGKLMYPDSYIADACSIYIVDRKKRPVYCVVLNKVYPKIVDDSQLASSSKEIISFRVQFVYESWESFNIEQEDEQFIAPPPVDFIKGTDGSVQIIDYSKNTGVNMEQYSEARIRGAYKKEQLDRKKREGMQNIWDAIQLARSGANSDSIKSMLLSAGTRQLLSSNKTNNMLQSTNKMIDSAIGSSLGGGLGKLKGIIL